MIATSAGQATCGKLPEEWEWKPLEYLSGDTDRRNPKQAAPQEHFQYIDIGCVDNETGQITGVQAILGEQAPSRARKVVRTDDIIVATTRPYLRNIAIVPADLDRAISSTGFCVLRIKQKLALPKYVYYFCRSDLFTEQLLPKQRGASYPAVTDSDIFEIIIPVPHPDNPAKSLGLQRRIVARIEALLAEVRSFHELLDEMRRDGDRLLSVAVDEVFNKLKSVTEIVPFEEVATAFNGKAVGEGTSNIRVFKSKHVYPHSLKMDRLSYMKEDQAQRMPKNRFLRPGDVLMANAAEGTLGRVSYVDKCEENWTVDGKIMILRSKNEQELSSRWLYYYLWSERGKREVLSRRTGTAFAENRGQTGISPTSVLEIPLLKPSINTQRQAVNYLDSVLRESEMMKELMGCDAKTLDLLEQSILERAFRGEL